MRPLPLFLLAAAAIVGAVPVIAQTVPAAPGSASGGDVAARPGLNERIDGAAGLNSVRSPHDTDPLAVPLKRGAAVTSPTTKAIEKAGSPSGAPLGTGAATAPKDTDPPTPAAARGDDPRAPG